MSFANQVAVITGASSGLGWALAKALAADGCRVGLTARRQDRLETLAEEIRRPGGAAAIAAADVGNRHETVTAIRDLATQLGPVDLLIANAGVSLATPLEPFRVEDIEEMIRVNYLGVVYAIEAVLPEMLRRGRGHLAAVSSLAAYKGLAGSSGYGASKAAVNTFIEGLRVQLRGRGIAVTTICPGFIRTPMTDVNKFPMPWLMETDQAARRILRALRRRRKVYNFPWPTTLVMKCTRWLPDWLLAYGLRWSKPEAATPRDGGR